MSPEKRCCGCKEVKSLDDFYEGFYEDCKKCWSLVVGKEQLAPGLKRCCDCKEVKSLDNFYDGKYTYCKPCWITRCAAFQKTPKGEAIQRRYRTSERGKQNRRAREKRYLQTENGKQKWAKKKKRRYWRDPDYHRLKSASFHHKAPVDVLKYILDRDQVCQICGSDKDLTFDHCHPVSRGGRMTEDNGQILCLPCNGFKQDRLFLAGNQGVILE